MFLAGTAQAFTIVSGDGSIFTLFAFSAFFLVCVGSLWQFTKPDVSHQRLGAPKLIRLIEISLYCVKGRQ